MEDKDENDDTTRDKLGNDEGGQEIKNGKLNIVFIKTKSFIRRIVKIN